MSKILIEKFYTAFQQKDWKAMQACYHPHAVFTDPVFQQLDALQVCAMWHMLLESGGALSVTFDTVESEGDRGSCHWEAKYLFSASGRPVHNRIDARFVFADGKILQHTDSFDLWKWSGMALGTSGKLLGWAPFLQNKIRSRAQKRLFSFIKVHDEYR